MHIHFVCSGNAYRSRLAEAYFKSIIQGKDFTVSSSGIEAELDRLANGPVCWYAMRLLRKNGLVPYMSWQEHQTTPETLKDVDLLICMRPIHLDYCQKLGYTGKSEVWEIRDLNELPGFIPASTPGIETDIRLIQLTEQTYQDIVQKVDELAAKL